MRQRFIPGTGGGTQDDTMSTQDSSRQGSSRQDASRQQDQHRQGKPQQAPGTKASGTGQQQQAQMPGQNHKMNPQQGGQPGAKHPR